MKEGWKYFKIKDIGTVIGGTTPAPQETYMGSYQKKEKFADLFGGLKYLV